jgi:tRNA uridine 5-carboxymethylaminomethyl modification enzyme
MEEQKGDEEPGKFSYSDTKPLKQQRSCWITYTSPEVHDILKTGFDRSPMFTGRIQGIGPRYCPSIEDKIDRFADKDRHQIFVEPEGWNTVEVYVNGFSTSLPQEVQYEALKRVPGFENAKFFRPGYAIEYDYFPPTQLQYTMETKNVEGLFFAGQINGTTGYEEAACQGLMAGINAHRKAHDESAVILGRSEAYIGVLIDDLITKGTEEPYRMFTSRAEYRLLLRQDNADIRLTRLGHDIGLADDARLERMLEKEKAAKLMVRKLDALTVAPVTAGEVINDGSEVKAHMKASKLLSRPGVDILALNRVLNISDLSEAGPELLAYVETEIKYSGYIARERENAEKIRRLEALAIPANFDYTRISGLSYEGKSKLSALKPATIGQASRISGVSPADVSVLLVFMGR